MKIIALALLAGFALLGYAATVQAGNCTTTCYGSGNSQTCNTTCF